ncbi:hypothetical Protein YC6258_04950 [Gynuella sunshinyii YC6258]|uniref:Uncharacterized protein n=1 Tax=Gynuella sunshinyii YC6258 TaxID=1445510 RepID=A0A0C5VQT8_9GAMM|nr:hypothetical Protein YC6258_04950 [Gynuella sunshinyii YC6258]
MSWYFLIRFVYFSHVDVTAILRHAITFPTRLYWDFTRKSIIYDRAFMASLPWLYVCRHHLTAA